MGELGSWARANRMLMLVLRCCPDPMPPTYLWRQPKAREWPVLVTTSLAVFNLIITITPFHRKVEIIKQL